jgi:hypothetical protein
MYVTDEIGLHARELLRERVGELVAEAGAWSVGMSDRAHIVHRDGRLVSVGTIGDRVATGLPLGGEEDVRLELGDARPGSFKDALNALTEDGQLYADQFDEHVVRPFVLDTCVLSAQWAQAERPDAWQELLDELGEDGDDLPAVVRAAEWEAPLRLDAEVLVLAAIGDAPLLEVEAEGLPLALVRAAEAETRAAAPGLEDVPTLNEDELAGAVFLAQAAVNGSALTLPVRPDDAERLLELLRAEGLEPAEVLAVLGELPVQQDTAEEIALILEAEEVHRASRPGPEGR